MASLHILETLPTQNAAYDECVSSAESTHAEPVPNPAESSNSSAEHVLIRVWLPDRPGALGLVASRIGAMRGDIVGIDVLETGEGVAVDEFAVNIPDAEMIPILIREIEEVDGVSVEEVRSVGVFPDPRVDALHSAATICEATSIPDLWLRLATHTMSEFSADWSAVIDDQEILASCGDSPAHAVLDAYVAGIRSSQLVTAGAAGPSDLAIAVLPNSSVVLLLGRDGHTFRQRERLQLLALARIAASMVPLLR